MKNNGNRIMSNLGLLNGDGEPLSISERKILMKKTLSMNNLSLSRREDELCCQQKCINDLKKSIFAP